MLKTHRFPIAFVGLSLLFGTIFYGNSGVMSYSPLVSPFGIASNIIDSDTGGDSDNLPKCDSRLAAKELLRLMNDTPRARKGGFEAKRVLSVESQNTIPLMEGIVIFSSYLDKIHSHLSDLEKSQLSIDFREGFNVTPERKKVIDEFKDLFVNQIQRNCRVNVTTNEGEKTVNLQITWTDAKPKRPKFNATWR
jgi:hypothetical protein